jgi:hypothetical protein
VGRDGKPQRDRRLRAFHRAEITRRYLLKHEPQREIACELGISQQSVSRELGQAQKEWKETARVDYDLWVVEELLRLGMLEAEFWKSWERSQQDVTKLVNYSRTSRTGDPKLLEGILKCIETRSRLLGLDDPQRIATGIPHEKVPGPATSRPIVWIAVAADAPRKFGMAVMNSRLLVAIAQLDAKDRRAVIATLDELRQAISRLNELL